MDAPPEPPSDPVLGIDAFARRASTRAGRDLTSYDALWRWSVDDLAGFWSTVWDHAGLPLRHPEQRVLSGSMPDARWFDGSVLNYAGRMFYHRAAGDLALLGVTESGHITSRTWGALQHEVASCAAWMRRRGVGPGDAVVGYLTNAPETVVAFLAAASIGATWGLCGLDYAGEAALARLGQLRPKILFAARQATNGGRRVDREEDVLLLRDGLPTLLDTVVVGEGAGPREISFADVTSDLDAPWTPEPLPFDHPLWVLFTSGTTGKPKGLVHGHGGVLLEQYKFGLLHLDLRQRDRVLWYTSPSWMMWNFVLGTMLCGAEIVCYDGSAGHPRIDRLWQLADELDVTVLGTSPGYLSACRSADIDLGSWTLGNLRLLGVTGSTFAADLHRWTEDGLSAHVTVASTSGGTDVCTAFVGHHPWVPVVAGELSTPCLGVDLRCFDSRGQAVIGEVGELVIAAPMPSMPLYFWDDPTGQRYRSAYFETFPDVWCHGDSITVTERRSVVIHGRSDATLNRHGVRMGSGDITSPVEQLPEVEEALVIGVEEPDGGYYMPLFVKLAEGVPLDDDLVARIRHSIRTATSPRHVPDEIVAAPGIPHTRTGKKLEVPIRRVFLGADPADVLDRRSVDDPSVLDWFAARAAERRT